jgi:hypothetical protein
MKVVVLALFVLVCTPNKCMRAKHQRIRCEQNISGAQASSKRNPALLTPKRGLLSYFSLNSYIHQGSCDWPIMGIFHPLPGIRNLLFYFNYDK